MKVKTQDKLTILSAFLVGIIAGSYLYLVGFAPEFENKLVPFASEEEAGDYDFTITGDMYGGMRAGVPPAFELKSDGEYHYVPFMETTASGQAPQTGVIPTSLLTNVNKALSAADLSALAKPVEKDMCAMMVDGIDYKYTVNVGDAEYRLDTCTTVFSADSDLGTALQAVWDYLGQSLEAAT